MKYVAFEGIDGAGKSTQVRAFSEWLTKQYYTVIALHEPTYGRYGIEVLKRAKTNPNMSLDEQTRLFTLDRQEHVKKKVMPLLNFVKQHPQFIIVQDRYYLSAPAYQAKGEPAMRLLLAQQQRIAPRPDMVFLLDVPVKTALERILLSREKPEGFERPEILERVRSNYLFLARECNERIHVIDSNPSSEDVCSMIVQKFREEVQEYEQR